MRRAPYSAASIVLFGLMVSVGCAPATPIRRSVLVPANAPPVRVGAPLERGETLISADVGPVLTFPLFGTTELVSPKVGDAGMYVPDVTLGASIYHAVGDIVEIGAHLRFAHYDWSRPSAAGVLPIPGGAYSLYGGAGLRLNLRPDDSIVTISPLFEMDVATVQEAQFFCESCSNGELHPTSDYRYEGTVSGIFILPKLGLVFDLRVTSYLHVWGGASVQAGVTNVGFDNDLATRGRGSVSAKLVGVPMGGVALDLDGWVLASTFSWPLSEETTEGPGLSLSVGYKL